ncbi:MAG: DUF3141 domain-containing protein [Rhodopseudomonas palustris]|nr:DUF3141 domain-containing protein [Rhodopseudomonas palustris]
MRFEPRTLDDVRAIVQPDPENERRFAAARRVSEINLGLYRTLFQPFVQAFASAQTAEWLQQAQSRRTALRAVLGAQPADAADRPTRRAGPRSSASPPRPTIPCSRCRRMISDAIIAALDGYRDLRDRSMEQIFLGDLRLAAAAGAGRACGPRTSRRAGTPASEPERARLHPAAHRRTQGAARRGRLARSGHSQPGLHRHGRTGGGRTRLRGAAPDPRRARRRDPGRSSSRCCASSSSRCCSTATARWPRFRRCCPPTRPLEAEALGKIRQVLSAVGEITGERAERLAQIEKLPCHRRLDQPAAHGPVRVRMPADVDPRQEARALSWNANTRSTQRLIDRLQDAAADVRPPSLHPCDESSLRGRRSKPPKLGLIAPILVGPRAQDRGGGGAVRHRHRGATRSSTRRTARPPPTRPWSWSARARPRR